MEIKLNSIPEAIEDFKAGKFLIVVDDEDREDLPKLAQALLGDPFKRLFTGIEKIHESLNFEMED